ncbi:hypothetical protein [Clostridium beijerinckii]|uniref:Uncharacterized protein n=1 Tax=Clostridium beijerinckii TaxID=1520 RepID=A0AAX0B003_CLOBE|nr:hypothetical protein [Clostridium beijerinckii]NRT88516.1 hypothetical protein [Clostridium beijerinckii]NYC73971.1 hypothetical protein [Clostridium beijerinckii]
MKKIQLPKSTNQCDEEPYFEMKNGQIIIKYSYEDEVVNSLVSIKFKSVYSFTYTECEYISTLDYSFGLIEVEDSKVKDDLLSGWKLRNRPINESFGGEVEKVKHYRLYFDDYGMYDIICKDIEIEEIIK